MIETEEAFQARISTMPVEEKKQAVDDRNLLLRGPEAKAGVDPDPRTFHAPPDGSEHPIYTLEADVRQHELALSRTAAFHSSDVQKTLATLKNRVRGIIDALPGPVTPSKDAPSQAPGKKNKTQLIG